MLSLRKICVAFVLIAGFSFASFADINGGVEFSGGIASAKLFGTDTSRYIDPGLQFPSTLRLSGFIGYNTGNEDSKVAIGFEQHLGIHLVTIASWSHLPLILSLPTRVYVRFGSEKVAFDLFAGIDNQFVLTGKDSYPAYQLGGRWYEAAPNGYSMGMEIGFRVVLRHFYFIAMTEFPIFDDYYFPGMIRLGVGGTF